MGRGEGGLTRWPCQERRRCLPCPSPFPWTTSSSYYIGQCCSPIGLTRVRKSLDSNEILPNWHPTRTDIPTLPRLSFTHRLACPPHITSPYAPCNPYASMFTCMTPFHPIRRQFRSLENFDPGRSTYPALEPAWAAAAFCALDFT